jgi:HPt (histidine-containing phosphotransfer) domain-containing protein
MWDTVNEDDMNWARVDELRSEVGSDAFAEVMDLFLEETDDMAKRLSAAADPATLGDDLHFMKGAALNLGFDELADACRDAEHTLRDAGAGAVDLTSVLRAYADCKAELMASEAFAPAG